MTPILSKHLGEISSLCREFGVLRLAVFGSAARDDFDPGTSDVDLLAEFRETEREGYADRYLDFAMGLEKVLGFPVDLLTPRALRNRYLAERVRRDAAVVYEDRGSEAP